MTLLHSSMTKFDIELVKVNHVVVGIREQQMKEREEIGLRAFRGQEMQCNSIQ